MSDQNPGGDGAASEKQDKGKPTRYRVLWGKMPDPDSEYARPVYREILNPEEPDGAYVATSAETARRRAFGDEASDQYPHMQQALKGHGLVLKHVALTSWGDDEDDLSEDSVLRIKTVEDLKGKI